MEKGSFLKMTVQYILSAALALCEQHLEYLCDGRVT
jgi:hypothetical protein